MIHQGHDKIALQATQLTQMASFSGFSIHPKVSFGPCGSRFMSSTAPDSAFGRRSFLRLRGSADLCQNGDVKPFRRLRESALQNGRVAMFATISRTLVGGGAW